MIVGGTYTAIIFELISKKISALLLLRNTNSIFIFFNIRKIQINFDKLQQ